MLYIAIFYMLWKVSGTRNERAHKTLREMGPPVINGAFSTFLSFSLLVFSDSHVFQSFFKVSYELASIFLDVVTCIICKLVNNTNKSVQFSEWNKFPHQLLINVWFTDLLRHLSIWSVPWINIFTCASEPNWPSTLQRHIDFHVTGRRGRWQDRSSYQTFCWDE